MLEDEFGDIIRKARTGRELDLALVAKQANLKPDSLDALEHLIGMPEADAIRLLAIALGLDEGKLAAIAQQRFSPQERSVQQATFYAHRLIVSNMVGWTSNCYLLNIAGSAEALIVDPGAQPKRILAALDTLGLTPRYVALTHGHGDHVGALKAVLRHWPVPVLVGSGDLELVGRLKHPIVMEDGQEVELGGQSIQALLVPGHTMGGVCYAFKGGCFVGDTLFAGSVGRPNVTGYYQRYLAAIKAKILSLPGETLLFPGHGPVTSVAEERAFNPFFAFDG